jgi:hypothetical protein
MSMAMYLRYVYMCAVGEKGMFAIPISKTDQCFFPFQHRAQMMIRGSEYGIRLLTLSALGRRGGFIGFFSLVQYVDLICACCRRPE